MHTLLHIFTRIITLFLQCCGEIYMNYALCLSTKKTLQFNNNSKWIWYYLCQHIAHLQKNYVARQ